MRGNLQDFYLLFTLILQREREENINSHFAYNIAYFTAVGNEKGGAQYVMDRFEWFLNMQAAFSARCLAILCRV